MTLKHLFTFFKHKYLQILQQLYNKIHLNNVLILMLLKLMQHLVLCCCYCPCGLEILFWYTCVMNIKQKVYNKIHLSAVIVLIFFFNILRSSVLLLLIKYYSHAQVRLVYHVLKILF